MKKLLRKVLLLIAAVPGVAVFAAAPTEPAGHLELTAEEQAWIQAHPVVRVGHDPTYAPYAFLDDRGRLVGIDVDFLDHIARRTGLQFKNELRADWAQVMADFKAGRVDMLASLGYLPERESFLIYSQPYGYAPDVIVTRDDSPLLFDIRDLKGQKIALVSGYDALRKEIQDNVRGAVIVEYATTEECLLAVAQGKVFGTISDVVNASYFVKTRRLTNLRLGSVVGTSHTNENRFGVRRDLPVLARIVDKALADISTTERQEISNRWVEVGVTEDWWSSRAFRIVMIVVGTALLMLGLVFLHNRRLARELAERRRIQAQLEEAHDRLALVSEQKSELLRTVTHDLHNPLTGLILGIDLLRLGGPVAPDMRQNLDQMAATGQQMMRLINDLVDANVLESGRRNFTWSRVDAAAVFRQATDGLTTIAARKGIQIHFNTQEPVMPIQSDLTAIRQVADNLISNAVKFSPRDTTVEVGIRWTGTGLLATVRDRGPGISPAARAKIFTQYGRGDAKPTGGEKSTGLGLWIVQRIVAALHGRVWSEDAPGGGTAFLVELPRQQPAVV